MAKDSDPQSPWGVFAVAIAGVCALLLSLFLVDPAVSVAGRAAFAPPAEAGVPVAAGTEASPGAVTRVEVQARGMAFSPATVSVPAGNRLILVLRNDDTMTHDLVLPGGQSTGHIAPGAVGEVDAGVITESTEAWCSLPGHRQLGMSIAITAVGGQAGGTAAAPPPPGPVSGGGHAHHGGGQAAGSTRVGMAQFLASPSPVYIDPLAPKLPEERVHKVVLRAQESVIDMGGGQQRPIWTFNGAPVAPTLRGRVGDEFEVTVINEGSMDHSIDFHASWLSPNEPMRAIAPGESHVYRFRAHRSGIWMYHCSTPPMSMHIAAGMAGAVIIDPDGLDPVEHEFVFVQSEIYPSVDGAPDAEAIGAVQPHYMAFNGVPYQYRARPIEVGVGERIRVWVLAAGPNLGSSFHVVGSQFDTVWTEGTYTIFKGHQMSQNGVPTGAQVLPLSAAQGGFVEFVLPASGDYPFVDHHMVRAEQGAVGLFKAR